MDSHTSQACSLDSVYAKLSLLGEKAIPEELVIHVLGADEKELPSLESVGFCAKWKPFLLRAACQGVTRIRFLFIGPNMMRTWDGLNVSFDYVEEVCRDHGGGSSSDSTVDLDTSITLHIIVDVSCELYHDYLGKHASDLPFIAIAFNAGIWGYDAWLPSLSSLFSGWHNGNSNATKKGYLVITSYTLEESEDDYDTVKACYDQVIGDDRLCWLWDCEKNPNNCLMQIERKSLQSAAASRDRSYHENNFWQCVSLLSRADSLDNSAGSDLDR